MIKKEKINEPMNQTSYESIKRQVFFLSGRWLIISIVLLVQIVVIGAALFNMKQAEQPDVVLSAVKGKPDICQVTYVAVFSDAWVNGIQVGMLVKAPNPFPGFPGLKGKAVSDCMSTDKDIDVQIIGQETILHISASSQSTNIIDEFLPYLLVIIFNGAGIIICLRASNRPAAWVAYSLFSFTSLIFFIANVHTVLWINVLIYILGLMTWGLATTFVCLLPHPAFKQRGPHGWSGGAYIPLIMGILLTAVSLPSIIWLPWIRAILWLLTTAYTLICIIVIGWTMFRGLRSLNASEKHITRIIVISIIFLLLALATGHNVVHYRSFVFNSTTPILSVPLMLLPIVCGYALLHHQFLGATSLFNRRIIRAVLWLLLASFFIVPTNIVMSTINVNIADQKVRVYCYAGLLLLCLWLFPLAWSAVRNIGDQVFYHDFYEYNRSLRELSAELARFQHLDQICAFILPRLTTLLNSTGAALLAYTPEQIQDEKNTGGAFQWHMYLNETPPFLPAGRLLGVANLALTHLKEPSARPLLLDEVLLFALYHGDTFRGFLCLGAKLNFEPYRREDKSFLATLAAQLSVLEVNSRYLEQAEADAKKLTALNHRVISAQEDERKRLAFELHDEVLQHAILLTRQLSDASSMTDVAEAMPLARSIVSSLRQTCLELRPPLLDELGLEEALYWLARQTEQRAEHGEIKGLQVKVSCMNTTNLRLPDEVELAFYRVVQEGLTNVLKHSQARKVTIQLRYQHGGGAALLMRDNGHGFSNEHPAAANEQLGLIGMRERMLAIGGQLQLSTHPGRGVTIQALYKQALEEQEEITERVEVAR
jgi:signal transduction histidine kinase